VDAEVVHEKQDDGSKIHTATVEFLGTTYTDVKTQGKPELTIRDLDSTDGIELMWNAIEDAVGYKVFAVKNGQEILLDTVTEPTYLVPQVLDSKKKPIELMMGETYGYLIVAVDADGNEIVNGTHDDFYNPFRDDVADDRESFEYIAWAYNNGLVTGTSHTEFDPEGSTTRMNFVMILYKMHGSPKVSGKNPFKDVTGSKSVKAVLWAYNKGLVKGTDKTHFSPDVNLSRMNIIMILYKLAGSPKVSGDNPFEDISGSKTVKAVTWAVQKGIITGVDDTHFDPDGDCSRELFVEVLCKYNKKYPII
jgi:hypothetical protein